MVCRAAVRDIPWLNVKGKEFSGEPALLHARDTSAGGFGRIPAEVVIVIGHRRRNVIVSVDDNRAPMDGEGSLPQRLVARGARLRRDGTKRDEASNQGQPGN